MNSAAFIKEAAKISGLLSSGNDLINSVRNVTPKAGFSLSPKWKSGLQIAGAGLAGNILGKNQGYNTGHEAGVNTGTQAGLNLGYGQGYQQAAQQAQGTGFMGRLMNKHNFQPTGPQGVDPALLEAIAQGTSQPSWLRRLTGTF